MKKVRKTTNTFWVWNLIEERKVAFGKSLQVVVILLQTRKKIMTEVEEFYSDLYSANADSNNGSYSFLHKPEIPKLTVEKKYICEGKLSVKECFDCLQSFENNKSPGNDGLTAEFYKTFWNSVGGILVDSLNCAYDLGELSNSQKQAIIKLIEKKEKDKQKICNWRPISLINVDAKVGSKAIATRLQRVLPDIIHHNQNAYVKGRSILDGCRQNLGHGPWASPWATLWATLWATHFFNRKIKIIINKQ